MNKYSLNQQELRDIQALLAEITSTYHSIEDDHFLIELTLFAHELPKRLKKFIHDFKMKEPGKGYFVVSGFSIIDGEIGQTPSHWNKRPKVSPTFPIEVFFTLCGSLLGDPFAWATQQGGYLIHDVMPIKKFETDQVGFSSQQFLTMHNEDAFHAYRPDYVGLMCMRNPCKTPTLIAAIEDIHLDKKTLKTLFEPHYTIRPDKSHLVTNKCEDTKNPSEKFKQDLYTAYKQIDKMDVDPIPTSILFGSQDFPYIRFDPYYMETPENPEARRAFDKINKIIHENIIEVVLEPGELIFLDNFRVVHGRSPFKANYDGMDRWLKRIVITRDLRKSRGSRISTLNRKVFGEEPFSHALPGNLPLELLAEL